jgi:DNA-directed RNA polymerase subunit K/omega
MADDYDAGEELDAAGEEVADEVNSGDEADALDDEKEGSEDEEVSQDEEDGGDEKADGTKCAYRHMRAKKSLKEDPIILEDLYDPMAASAVMGGYEILNDDLRITDNYFYMTEFQRILGVRTQVLASGAPARVRNKNGKPMSPEATARLEMRNGLAPYIIIRPRPGYKVPTAERWYFRELSIPDWYWELGEMPPLIPRTDNSGSITASL